VRICVDTSVLLDVLKDEYPEYQDKLYNAISEGEKLLAPVVVYAELMPQFRGDTKLLDEFFEDHRISIKDLDISSAEIAASRWMLYLKTKKKARCPECAHVLPFRKHVLSDFYIGGFALSSCDRILTRDRGIFRTYFKDLRKY
jgi:predicted nucleic acid-binding protein